MKLGPSENLSWDELKCKDGTEYPSEWRENRAFDLAYAFEDIRAIYNKPIKILSAYRTESHNTKIGGAKNSQHVQGRALDLLPPSGIIVEQFYNDIKNIADRAGIHGLGKYATFVHIDIRPVENLVTW